MPHPPRLSLAAVFLFALTQLPACTRIDPDRPAALNVAHGDFLLDAYHSDKSLIEQALAAYQEAMRLEPGAPEAYVGLSRAYGTAGDFPNELKSAQDAAARFPQNAPAQFQLAFALGDNDKFSEAVPTFERAARLDPDLPHLDAQLSWTCTQLGEHAKAVEAAKRGVTREPDYAFGFQQFGDALLAAGKIEEAIAPFQRSSALNPSDPWAYKRLSDTYNALDRYPEALAVLQKAVARFPDELVLAIDYGTCLQAGGRPQEALAQLAIAEKIAQQKVAADPTDVQAINSLGVTQEYQGKLDAAFATYSRILTLAHEENANHTLALRNIANTLVKSHKYDDAVDYFRRSYATSKEPNDQRMVALTLFYAGKNAESLAECDSWLAANDPASHVGRYMAIHAHLLALSLPKTDPAKYLALAQSSKDPAWPAPCVDYLANKISEPQLLTLATDNDKQTEARTYLGFQQIFTNHKPAGLAHLQWVQKNGNPHFTETDQATAYLLK